MTLYELPRRRRDAIRFFFSAFVLLACLLIVFFLISLDDVVNRVLYEFGLRFSYDWAYPYWMFLRITLVLVGLIALGVSFDVVYRFWEWLQKPVPAISVQEALSTERETWRAQEASTLSFRCTSCGKATNDPIRLAVYVCPVCKAPAVPVSYAKASDQLAELQLDELKTVVRSYLKAGVFTLDDFK